MIPIENFDAHEIHLPDRQEKTADDELLEFDVSNKKMNLRSFQFPVALGRPLRPQLKFHTLSFTRTIWRLFCTEIIFPNYLSKITLSKANCPKVNKDQVLVLLFEAKWNLEIRENHQISFKICPATRAWRLLWDGSIFPRTFDGLDLPLLMRIQDAFDPFLSKKWAISEFLLWLPIHHVLMITIPTNIMNFLNFKPVTNPITRWQDFEIVPLRGTEFNRILVIRFRKRNDVRKRSQKESWKGFKRKIRVVVKCLQHRTIRRSMFWSVLVSQCPR